MAEKSLSRIRILKRDANLSKSRKSFIHTGSLHLISQYISRLRDTTVFRDIYLLLRNDLCRFANSNVFWKIKEKIVSIS